MQAFRGRPILPGAVTGPALVSHTGFNTLASFQRAVVLRQKRAVCSDGNNPDLHGRVLTGAILCLPQTVGSTAAGLALATVASTGAAPAAMLFAESVDSLAAAGVVLADVWVGKRIITVDRLGQEFLAAVRQGQTVEVSPDGTVTLR